MRKKVLAILPHELLNQAVSFEELDEGEMSWTPQVIESVIAAIMKGNASILRGRVFSKSDDIYFFTGLEWDVERNEHNWNAFVQKSAKISLAFIKRNQIQDEDNFYALQFLDEEEMMIRTRLPKSIPERFINSAYPLTSIDCTETAWKYEDIIQIIAFYTENRFIILGGDVCKMDHNDIYHHTMVGIITPKSSKKLMT